MLPGGWTQHKDAQGREYLYNGGTGETRWLWTRHEDPQMRGREFMYNNVTGERLWIDETTRAAVSVGNQVFGAPAKKDAPSANVQLNQQPHASNGAAHPQRMSPTHQHQQYVHPAAHVPQQQQYGGQNAMHVQPQPQYNGAAGAVAGSGAAVLTPHAQTMYATPQERQQLQQRQPQVAPVVSGVNQAARILANTSITAPPAVAVNGSADGGTPDLLTGDASTENKRKGKPKHPKGGSLGGGQPQSEAAPVPPNGQRLFMNEIECVSSSGRPYAFNKDTRKSRWLPRDKPLPSKEDAVALLQRLVRGRILVRDHKPQHVLTRLKRGLQHVEKLVGAGGRYDLAVLESVVQEYEKREQRPDYDAMKAHHVDLLHVGEAITKEMLQLDGIDTKGLPSLRTYRKLTAQRIVALGDKVDVLKHRMEQLMDLC
ncbi:hypothetical protein FVE85_3084 [Porphyridium purpureum]|uniref:Uncharacterized protein n=1 Tax=Porphyridium purpureum TaxID=35688 RepID=A0A5J4YVT3_PORPP|nr:hypothetical protein FVE85_3084 [Porphyridium purpureum]|eukprot:POR7582..scf227_4